MYLLNCIKIYDFDYIQKLKKQKNIKDEFVFITKFLKKNKCKDTYFEYNMADKIYLDYLIINKDYIIKNRNVVKDTDYIEFIKHGKNLTVSKKKIIMLSPYGILKYYELTKLKTSLYLKLLVYCLENY